MTAAEDYWVCHTCGDEVRLGTVHECPGRPEPKPKGRPGRPKGSKNRPKTKEP